MFMGETSDNNSNSSDSEDVPHYSYTENNKLLKYQEAATSSARKDTGDLDGPLARLEAEKKRALIKAWEESEKTKIDNRAYKMQFAVGLWEDSKKASVEAKLKKNAEKMERKKAEYFEKMQNKIAEIHRMAEEKRAGIEAQRGKGLLKIEDTAENFRTRGYSPKKILSCFSA
ncbi:hypothetical protein HN51_012641 [Arachis hypogaea]|uniref:Remorin C-terminal domain-containing protein n=2 Tax=Arachis TaxID=3817 RepID=A0A445DTK7_ARAHY|nr:remorin [Arachis duranensis]XP_025689340.1 remorin [Arachis hypogaea]XP_057752505.1 remorin-like [Arachis stenosperma]QHO58153.1 Remorin [Arachis hypogaea]RYR66522.1 hypothetical protein Ahy_A03g012535 [Arachis hypogaea]